MIFQCNLISAQQLGPPGKVLILCEHASDDAIPASVNSLNVFEVAELDDKNSIKSKGGKWRHLLCQIIYEYVKRLLSHKIQNQLEERLNT